MFYRKAAIVGIILMLITTIVFVSSKEQSYQLRRYVFNGVSGRTSSSNEHQLQGIVGQPVIGYSQSENGLHLSSGYPLSSSKIIHHYIYIPLALDTTSHSHIQ